MTELMSELIIKHSKEEWDTHFLKIAKLCSEMSKDPSTKVGAVIVSEDRKILATGYNGFPKSVPDYALWYNNREIKYSIIIHAEENALSTLTMNTNDIHVPKSVYIYPLEPCLKCYNLLKDRGINRFISVAHKIENNFCKVCNKPESECSTKRWPTKHYKEDDEVIIMDIS